MCLQKHWYREKIIQHRPEMKIYKISILFKQFDVSIISKGTCADNLQRNEEPEDVHYICTEDKHDQCQVNYVKKHT